MRAATQIFVTAVALAVSHGSALAQDIPLVFQSDHDSRTVSVVVTPDRTSMRGLSRSLRDARERMHARGEVTDQELRDLAAAGDGLAAQRYVRRLVERGAAVTQASDVAFYASLAVGRGRVWTLPDMIAAMRHLDPSTEPRDRVRRYISVLYPHAWAGNSAALDAVIEFNGEGALFGALSQRTLDRILEEADALGDGRTELRMAMALLEQQTLSEAEQSEARNFLTKASRATHLGVRVTATNLLALMDKSYGPKDDG